MMPVSTTASLACCHAEQGRPGRSVPGFGGNASSSPLNQRIDTLTTSRVFCCLGLICFVPFFYPTILHEDVPNGTEGPAEKVSDKVIPASLHKTLH